MSEVKTWWWLKGWSGDDDDDDGFKIDGEDGKGGFLGHRAGCGLYFGFSLQSLYPFPNAVRDQNLATSRELRGIRLLFF